MTTDPTSHGLLADAGHAPPTLARGRRQKKRGFALRDVGVIPLLVAMPLMYWPKVLEGDTQPWVLVGALIAFLTFRTNVAITKGDLLVVVLSIACVAAYWFRRTVEIEFLRAAYIQVAFAVVWLVCRRERADIFPNAVRATILIWFVIGLYQFIAPIMGWDIAFFGRFGSGNAGIPSMTAEPSFYGSLSVVQLMYIISEKKVSDRPFILCAAFSAMLSGSLLAVLLLIFPLMKLRLPLRMLAIGGGLLVATVGSIFTVALQARLGTLGNFAGTGLENPFFIYSLLKDPSLNLRIGHIYFTLWHNLIPSLLLLQPVAFMSDYNHFAAISGLFIATGSNFILPSGGELIYGAGIAGALLIATVIHQAQLEKPSRKARLLKTAFILACMLNPVSISNIFLIMYIQKKT